MPVAVNELQLAASAGHDQKREVARRNVARDFFERYIFALDKPKDWAVIRRAMQTVDLSQPVMVGPAPAAPSRLAQLPSGGGLGPGFFAELAPAGAAADYWIVLPQALYLKFHAPSAWAAEDVPPEFQLVPRYFIPFARHPKGERVAMRDRS